MLVHNFAFLLSMFLFVFDFVLNTGNFGLKFVNRKISHTNFFNIFDCVRILFLNICDLNNMLSTKL